MTSSLVHEQEGLLNEILGALRAADLAPEEQVQAGRESAIEFAKGAIVAYSVPSHCGVGALLPRSCSTLPVDGRFGPAPRLSRDDRRFEIIDCTARSAAQDTLLGPIRFGPRGWRHQLRNVKNQQWAASRRR
jgi:hypothetical protein